MTLPEIISQWQCKIIDLIEKKGFRFVAAIWALSLLFSLGSGFATLWLKWTGIPLHFGGVEFHVSLYPPIILASIWALFFGFWWGAIPAYLTSFVLGVSSGMAVQSAIVFSMANPIGLAVLSLGYRAFPERPTLRTPTSLIYFSVITFVSSTLSSIGAFYWAISHDVAMTSAYSIWQGWWVGNFLQDILIVGPFLILFGSGIIAWLLARNWIDAKKQFNPTLSIGIGATIITGVLMFMFINSSFVATKLYKAGASSEAETVSVLFLVSLVTLGAFGFFAYKFYIHATSHIQSVNEALAETNQTLERLTRTDELTGLANRRHFSSELAREVERAIRYQHPTSLICFDVDHFKKINDTYLHATGDAVLRQIGVILMSIVRDSDIAARIGGEEFVVLLPDTALDQAYGLAKRIQTAFQENPVSCENQRISFTASFGVAELNPDQNADHFLASADRLMFQSKNRGRNQISTEPMMVSSRLPA